MEELINKNQENTLSHYLNNLRILKQNGTLDIDENCTQHSLKWRNTLEYYVLETYVGHYSEECRLKTLALLVESRKSTLGFTSKELDMILLFLKYNLCEKMEYIPFIKKALKRLRDSLAVMRRRWTQQEKMRNHHKKQNITSEACENALFYQMSEQIECNIKDYTTFFINLREICVNNLYPDATYHRRRSSLQILLLMQEFLYNEFKDIEWRKEQVETIFQCLLLDTYEPNKEMAYQLLKYVNPILLNLHSKSQVQLIIKVALELGNSIRPIDSITAAYMLKISMLSPVIKNVLCDYYNIDDNVTEAMILQLVLLLYRKLQEALALAKQNIGMVIVKCSLYGYLFCIRSLLSDYNLRDAGMDKLWQDTVANIILLCFELNHTVSVVINNSSPEGHLPMDLETLNFDNDTSFPGKEIITPQMVLLCSWRTVKEVSHLFGLFATKASIQTNEFKNGLLTEEQFEQIMRHLVSLLCETKHRGAFEQVYVGFHQLCTRLWQLANRTLNILPIRCLHDTLIGITGLMPGYSKLCATRRSAGVPFLIQAVLSSALKNGDYPKKHFFHSVMKILLQFTKLEDTVNLWQKIKCIMYENSIFSCYKHLMEPRMENEYYDREVKPDVTEIKIHSMNILRALFRHSQLGDIVKNYIADGLVVAFKNYDGRTWAERNAATLLFSALIVRIFGVQRTKDHINLTTCNTMTGRLFFERYPSLLPFILEELRTFISTNDTMIKSNVQAILLLLSRLYINNFHETDNAWKTDELRNLVSQCAKSPVHQTRELAARALVPLLTESTVYGTLTNLLQLVLQTIQDVRDFRASANQIHGYLLQILKILWKFPSDKELLKPYEVIDLLTILQCILNYLKRRPDGFNRFPIATIYVDILHELYRAEKDIIDDCKMKDILHTLQQCLTEKDLSKPGQPWPGEQLYKISVIRLMLCVGKYSNFLQIVHNGQSKMFEIYSKLLITPEAEIQSIAWSTVSEVLTREQESKQRNLLGNYAIHVAVDFTKNLYKHNPDVQDALFDFLYNCLMNADEWFITDAFYKRREICILVLQKIHSHNANNVYLQRVNYLRLLGKCMATLIHKLTDKKLEMEYKEDIYRKVCDSNWIEPVLDWWTMILQLLVDDNMDIRREACKLICNIEPSNELECIEKMLPVFFRKFNDIIADKCPEIAISAFFCWSVSLLGDTDYEMDETDVFNKCRNYDVFEPVRISEMCYDLTKSVVQRYSIDSTLPLDIVKWINYRLDVNFATLSFKDIVRSYMSNVPTIEKELVEILDPTYRDKLLQVLACQKYAAL
ncbi:PREDICTED: thyroid adenoma-associated protein isoform X2 [Dinoponera quadriceps]|uniref:tRNA (32-2'-O)-methyltransferase regulator THADA n=1 Tax=Dinoponera quadriceps TaxID=609295 RepID=A0A6P3WRW9_DINQU|nr:PREDICTED: thyroid adenoma-associated protein isoform X2 [Dinoponera quadriceps]